jgi:hypothetical protein
VGNMIDFEEEDILPKSGASEIGQVLDASGGR